MQRGWYIYIYIVIHRQICFVLSELISVARHISFLQTGSKPSWLKRQAKPLTLQPRGAISCEVNFKWLWITITIVYIHPFNGYRDLNSYMKRLAINANGNTITSFAGELNPTGAGEYVCVCVCVCVFCQQIIVQTNFVIYYGVVFLMIFMFGRSLLVSFRMSWSKWLRNCPIFTQAVSAMSLVVLMKTIVFLFFWWVIYICRILHIFKVFFKINNIISFYGPYHL